MTFFKLFLSLSPMFFFSVVQASLVDETPDLKPNGQLIYCKDGGSARAEFLFAETLSGDYVLRIREKAFEGQTLGQLISDDLDPVFMSGSKGPYLELTTHLPATIKSSNVQACKFSSISKDAVSCLGEQILGDIKLSDGLHLKVLSDNQIIFSTENRSTVSADEYAEQTVLKYTLYGSAHPFPEGYSKESSFDSASCTTR